MESDHTYDNKDTDKKAKSLPKEVIKNLVEEQQDIPPEFESIINDFFWELI